MSLAIATTFARRELRAGLRNGLRGFRIFIACLALGVAAIATIGTVRAGIKAGLALDGALLLGGDAEIEFTYRFATDQERAWMTRQADRVSEIVDFRSMAVVTRAGVTERGLTQVKAVDDLYPLIGSVGLEGAASLAQALATRDLPGGVMQRVLADRLGLQIGDSFALGLQEFRLAAILEQEPDGAGGGFGLGPRTIVRTADLATSELIQPGTLYSTKYRLDLPDGADLADLQSQAETQFATSGLRWSDARNGAPGVSEFVDRLGSFLILVGLSGLAVGGIGVSAAVRSYLSTKTGVIATLKTLGASRRVIFSTYGIQVGILTVVGIGLGLVIGAILPVLFAPLLEGQLPIPAQIAIYRAPLIEAALYGALSAMIFTLWPLARTEDIRAAALFREAFGAARTLPAWRYVGITLLLLAALVTLAAWFSGATRLTLWTFGGIAIALGLLVLAAMATRWLSRMLAKLPLVRGRTGVRMALASIAGPRDEASSVVLSVGLGLAVLAAVGQIDGNLRNAIQGNLPDVAPSYFFVDIQTDQLDGFNERLTTDPQVTRVETAPMLRGIITQINGRPAHEVAGNHWVLEGDRGVTYSATQPATTTLTAGTWWAQDYTGPPQISFAAEEAQEMGLALGDQITVNILGRDITAKVTSFRVVDFSNAGIGFIMSMNPAALSGAPHTHIATVYAEESAEAQILRDLASAYPNITAIRVRDAIDRVAGVIGRLATAISYGAAASLVTGFLVLIGSAAAGVGARTYEAAILKTLGASRMLILRSFALRAAILGASAGAVALGAGILAAWAVSRFVLDTSFGVIWPSALGVILGGILATLLASIGFAWRPLSSAPAQVLRAKE